MGAKRESSKLNIESPESSSGAAVSDAADASGVTSSRASSEFCRWAYCRVIAARAFWIGVGRV